MTLQKLEGVSDREAVERPFRFALGNSSAAQPIDVPDARAYSTPPT
jgi:hypothetical protein